MSEPIPFHNKEGLIDLLANAPDGTILANSSLLCDRSFPQGVLTGFDYDFTITAGPLSSWQEVRNPNRRLLSQNGIERTLQDFHTWRHQEGIRSQRLWANSSTKIMRDEGITKAQLVELGTSLKLRDRFFALASNILSNGPLAIVTWAMSCIVEPSIRQIGLPITNFNLSNDIPSGILCYAEEMRFDKRGIIIPPPIKPGPNSVLGLPKFKFMQDFKTRTGKLDHGIVFIGDSADVDGDAAGPDGRAILIVDGSKPNPDIVLNKSHFILVGSSLLPLIDLLRGFDKPQEINLN